MQVLRKMGARFHRHDYSDPGLRQVLRTRFSVYTLCLLKHPFQSSDPFYRGDPGRIQNTEKGVLPVRLAAGNSPAFIRLTRTFTALCQEYYSNARLDVAEWRYDFGERVMTAPDDDPEDDGLSSFEAFTSEQVLALFNEALASKDWVADKIPDQMPSHEKQSVHSIWTSASKSRSKASSASRLKRHLDSSRTAPVDAKRPRTRGSKSSKSSRSRGRGS